MSNNCPITGLIKDWEFRIDEVSASHYVMAGLRRTGETVLKEGSNKIELAENISIEALELDKKYLNPNQEPFKKHYFNTDLADVFPQELKKIILEEIMAINI